MMLKNVFQIIVFVVGAIGMLCGQNAETNLKDWEKKKSEMSPMQFKSLVEDQERLKAELAALKANHVELQNQESKLKEENYKLKTDFENYRKSVSTAQTMTTNEVDGSNTAERREKYGKGVVFKVQIGAFKNKDLTKYFENNKNFSGDIDPDGVKKYTLGYFNEYWEAEQFKKYLREMGVKDAWIVPYKNGQRVPMRDVLEGIL